MHIYLMRNSRYYNKIIAAASRTEDVTSDSHIVVYKEDSLRICLLNPQHPVADANMRLYVLLSIFPFF